jgi:hypothetical protein
LQRCPVGLWVANRAPHLKSNAASKKTHGRQIAGNMSVQPLKCHQSLWPSIN